MFEFKTIGLFLVTALAEILGCYLPYLWLKQDKSILLLIPAALCLALFAWLLSLHPEASGRVYAAYGGVYIFVAILWLWLVGHIRGKCRSNWHGHYYVCTKITLIILMISARLEKKVYVKFVSLSIYP